MTKASAAIPAPRQTIFRRKRSVNFTVLGNAVLFDKRLDLDERGAIVMLLAKPHDWQIKPNHLMTEWGVGREKFYRIINNLIRYGYITRGEMIKDAWQRFTACEYIINEEPDAPPVETAGVNFNDNDEADDEPVADAASVADVSQSGFPHTGDPHTENQHGEKELRNIQTKPPLPPTSAQDAGPDGSNSPVGPPKPERSSASGGDPSRPTGELQTSQSHRTPPEGARGPIAEATSGTERIPTFDDFVAKYRPEPHMSLDGAHRRWLRLSERDRIDAVQFLDDFRADRSKRGWKMPDMRRYLMDKHWVPYAKAAAAKPTRVAIKPYSAQWYRWREYRIATGQRIGFFDDYPKRYTGDWYEPSEWPPALPPKPPPAPENAPALGPQGDDLGEFR